MAIVSLSCGAVLEWAVGPYEGKQTGETALLRSLAQHLKGGDVVIIDRCYSGYFMIALMVELCDFTTLIFGTAPCVLVFSSLHSP